MNGLYDDGPSIGITPCCCRSTCSADSIRRNGRGAGTASPTRTASPCFASGGRPGGRSSTSGMTPSSRARRSIRRMKAIGLRAGFEPLEGEALGEQERQQRLHRHRPRLEASPPRRQAYRNLRHLDRHVRFDDGANRRQHGVGHDTGSGRLRLLRPARTAKEARSRPKRCRPRMSRRSASNSAASSRRPT